MRFVERDDNLPHQIRLMTIDEYGSVLIGVSCTCRAKRGGSNPSYEPMPGYTESVEQSWEIFNDPKNHRTNKGQAFRAPVPKVAQERSEVRATP